MAGVFGYVGKLAVGDALPTTPVHLDILSESMSMQQTFADLNGLKGTRSRYAVRARPNIKRVGGNISINPTAVDLAYLLPKILGGTPSGTSYPFAETLPTFDCWIVRGAGTTDLFQYAGCGVTRGTLSGRTGEGVLLSLDVVGQTETLANVSAYPAGGIDTTTPPFMHYEATATVGGVTVQFSEFSITVDNAIDAERFLNSTTLVTVQPTDRTMQVTLTVPYGDNVARYPITLDSTGAGVASVITLTSGAVSLTITMTKFQIDRSSPVLNGRGEVVLILSGMARVTAALGEAAFVLDSTP